VLAQLLEPLLQLYLLIFYTAVLESQNIWAEAPQFPHPLLHTGRATPKAASLLDGTMVLFMDHKDASLQVHK
jgi:hypothetical protein